MQYQCNQGHRFLFPDVQHEGTTENWIESKVCPICDDPNVHITEFVEPQEDIVSVRSVSLEEVDGYLLQGYKVRELYAKTGTLVKMEVKP